MAYARKSPRSMRPAQFARAAARRRALGMGDVVSEIENAVTTALSAVSDPYLGEVMCHIGQLQQVKSGQVPTPCTEVPYGQPGGIGVDNVAVALRGYVYAQENPWVVPVAIAAVVGIPFFLGYMMGKG